MSGILVIGRTGQVARALAEAPTPAAGIRFLGRDELDLSDLDAIGPAVAAAAPDLVLNAAAYTAVDKAEEETGLANRINGEAVGALAKAAAEAGAPFLHLSTDYVYPGTREGMHVETDAVDPINAYGASKLAGEQAALAANPRTVILRTAWVYAPWGKNFVLTMLRLADREKLTVVEDQHGQPTSAIDIAEACLAIAPRLVGEPAGSDVWGIYHFAGKGPTVWADFAREVFVQGKGLGLIDAAPTVEGIPTSGYPTPARRPANSTLDCTRFETVFGHPTTPWREALARVLARHAEIRREGDAQA